CCRGGWRLMCSRVWPKAREKASRTRHYRRLRVSPRNWSNAETGSTMPRALNAIRLVV
ncbi:MAG: hypothetical protein AVDCRST_MAG93-420, partial [uncultured Chloroflexia bacterium]